MSNSLLEPLFLWFVYTSAGFSRAEVVVIGGLMLVWNAFVLWYMQRSFNQSKKEAAQASTKQGASAWWSLELWAILLSVLPPIGVPALGVRWLRRWIKRAAAEKSEKAKALTHAEDGSEAAAAGTSADASDTAPAIEEAPPEVGWLAPTLGPIFAAASFAVLVIFTLGELTKPILAGMTKAPTAEHFWNWVFWGKLSWGGPLMTMRDIPSTAFAINFFVWFVVWAIIALVLRLYWWSGVGNQGATPDDIRNSRLKLWREWGTRALYRPDRSFASWAGRCVGAIWVVLLMGAALYLVGRLSFSPQSLVVALLFAKGLTLHLLLRGDFHEPAPAKPVEAAEPKEALPGWDAVMARLKASFGSPDPVISASELWEDPLSERQLAADRQLNCLSALLRAELIEEGGTLPRPTLLQAQVLEELSSAVTHAPQDGAKVLRHGVNFDDGRADIERKVSSLYVAGAIGTGKSTLAMFAALNHVLRFSASVLMIYSDEESAKSAHTMMSELMRQSPLRWSVQVRNTKEIAEDTQSASVPDIIIADLDWVMTELLRREELYRSFTENLGLMVVGGVDRLDAIQADHAQLIFGRLNLRLARAQGVAMDDSSLFNFNGCSLLVFSSSENERWYRRAERIVKRSFGKRMSLNPERRTVSPGPNDWVRQTIPLASFVDERSEPLRWKDLVDACEEAKVPWTYLEPQTASTSSLDAAHARQGAYFKTSAQEAVVVFVPGRLTHVRRELERLSYAGSRFIRTDGPRVAPKERKVTLVQIVDRDEEMAFNAGDASGSIHSLISRLPQPLERAPGAEISEAHLGVELFEREMEADEIVRVFGERELLKVSNLARRAHVRVEVRHALGNGEQNFEERAWLRLKASGLRDSEESSDNEKGLIPPAPTSIREFGDSSYVVFNAALMEEVERVTEVAARLSYFPDAILPTDKGVVKVLSDARKESLLQERGENFQAGANHSRMVFVEPFSEHYRSIPEQELSIASNQKVRQTISPGGTPLQIDQVYGVLSVAHIATRWVNAETFEYLQRRTGHSAEVMKTSARALTVGLQGLLDQGAADDLREDVLKVLSSVVRLSLGFVYDVDEREMDASVTRVDGEDVLAFFEFQEENSGALDALLREGLEHVLRVARMYLERVLSHERLLSAWCDRPMEVTLRARLGSVEAVRAREAEVRKIILTWLDDRLPVESGAGSAWVARSYPSGSEAGEGSPGDLGRVWITSADGVQDLHWRRLQWIAPRGDFRRTLDVGVSRDFMGAMRQLQTDVDESWRQEIANKAEGAGAAKMIAPPRDGIFESLGGDEAPAELNSADANVDDDVIIIRPKVGFFKRLWQMLFGGKRVDEDELDGPTPGGYTELEETSTWEALDERSVVRASLRNFQNTDKLWDDTPVEELRERVSELALFGGALNELVEDAMLAIEPVMKHVESSLGSESDEAQDHDVLMREVLRLVVHAMERNAMDTSEERTLTDRLPRHPAEALFGGKLGVIEGVCLIAAVQAQLDLPAGIFISHDKRHVMAALYAGSAHDAEAVSRWRLKEHAHVQLSASAERRIAERPYIATDVDDETMLAVDLRTMKGFGVLDNSHRQQWYYLSLEPEVKL